MKFLHEEKPSVFVWSNSEDIHWQPETDIIDCLSEPVLLPGRGLKLKFDATELSACKENC